MFLKMTKSSNQELVTLERRITYQLLVPHRVTSGHQ
ncbi:hypothetical protein SLEP1_g23899 [Rubroshorea leprosula]|uniref:Uncharacterized protein n=1 Tax=Rubroshorea leprosula TaxID=152421 RepID=A0AAV5JK39_9ROSI|nr:hypothetical protein SLEP1_g23899 [Rubroshorea leprosula]